MSKRYVQVPISHLEPIFSEWENAFETGHFVNVFFMPYGDLLFRAMQFADWMNEKKKTQVKLINFETELIVNPENLQEVLENNQDQNLILLAKRAFMRPDAVAMVGVLEKWYAREGRGALIFHEGFPSEISHYVPRPVMMQAQLIHSSYPPEATKEYIRTTASLFGVEVDDETSSAIVHNCGGIPWLINDVLRRAKEDDLFSHENLKWKVEQIAKSIPRLPGVEKDIVAYGFKNDKGEWLPLFKSYFEKSSREKLQVTNSRIIFEDRDITTLFSSGERRILFGLKTSEGLVGREQIGQFFWQEKAEIDYSDWALDTIMSRLRKKIAKLGLPIVIKTRRGGGYESL